MKIRQTIKKAVALGTGALMLGATILGASASLSDFPTNMIKDGKVNAKIVVGEKAATQDVVGAIDLAAHLQANAVSVEAVKVSGSGIEVSGGKTKEVDLGGKLGASYSTIDDTDVSSLKDEKISWNDETLDVEEQITVPGVKVLTSVDDEDFGSDIFLGTVDSDAIVYKYIIDDSDLDWSLVTDSDPLKVEILGKALEIQDVTNGSSDSIKITVASEYYLNIGDSITVEGKTVKLVNVGSSSVVVDVDGTIETIANDGDEKINGIRVSVPDGNIFYVDEKEDRAVTLKIGDKITETVKSGDSMETFGEPSSSSDAEWVWYVEASGTDNKTLAVGATYNKKYDSDTEPVNPIGEKLTLPNDYASIYIDSLTADADAELKFEFEDGIAVDKDASGNSYTFLDDQNALKITSNKEILKFGVTGEETDLVYLIANSTNQVFLAIENSDGDIQLQTGVLMVDYEETDLNMTFNSTDPDEIELTIIDEDAELGGKQLVLDADITNKKFGDTVDDFDGIGAVPSKDLNYTGTLLSGIDKDEDYRTTYGIIISALEDGFDSDVFTMTLPGEQVKANAVVAGSGAVISSSGGSVTTQKVNPIGVDFGVLDKDAPAAGTTNLIIVGGPCANTEAARVMGNPTPCGEGFEEGTAKLALFDDDGKIALLVAGYSADDTSGAVRALINEDLPDKSDAKVITTNAMNPSIE